MLATLTGGAALPMVDPFEESDQPEALEPGRGAETRRAVEVDAVETQDETDEQGTED